MNGFAEHSLNEGDFGDSFSVKAFDAFPKTKPSYLTRTRNGGIFTVWLALTCAWLASTEIHRWFVGHTVHTFSVEKGIGHDLQINLDIIVAMRCSDLHVNIQDASGDHVRASEILKREDTAWVLWGKSKGFHKLGYGVADQAFGYESLDVHDYLGAATKKRGFYKSPRLRGPPDACRIYGSVEGNKVQGDFHITARGHGYMEFGEHLDHNGMKDPHNHSVMFMSHRGQADMSTPITAFNFSHIVNELSFGPFFPSLVNPLDSTVAITPAHFYKYQYFLSIVPTIYTDASRSLLGSASSLSDPGVPSTPFSNTPNTIFTNQYAVTSQSHVIGENQIPGIFVKYDIEPILLTISEEWGGIPALLVRLVNVVSGVLVAGGWIFQLYNWASEIWGRKGRKGSNTRRSSGLLHGEKEGEDEGPYGNGISEKRY